MRCRPLAQHLLIVLLCRNACGVSLEDTSPKIRRERRRGRTPHDVRRGSASPTLVEVSSHGEPTVLSSDVQGAPALRARYPFYHLTAEIGNAVKELADTCADTLEVKHVTEDEVSLDVVTLRRQPRDGRSANAVANRVFMLFGEHPRELISPESGLGLLQRICSGGAAASVLDHSEFLVVLNANPRSRAKVENGEFCLRTNPSGVDLNRNWDEMWKSGDNGFGDDTNPGPKPFSEPETRLLKALVSKYKPTTFVTVHSGTRGLYMPWAYDTHSLASRNQPQMLEILKAVDDKHCQCPYGAAGKEVGYACPGTCLDWVFDQLQTQYAFAVEIYVSQEKNSKLEKRWEKKMRDGGETLLSGGAHLGHPHFSYLFREFASDFVQQSSNASSAVASKKLANDECFKFFNPHTAELYQKTVDNWVEAYIQLASMVSERLGEAAAGAGNKTAAPQMPI